MKIALAQLNTIVGDIEGNTRKIISTIKNAKANIVVFPELCITGYSPQDLTLKDNFIQKNMAALRKIIESTRDKAAIVGFVENAQAFLYKVAKNLIIDQSRKKKTESLDAAMELGFDVNWRNVEGWSQNPRGSSQL